MRHNRKTIAQRVDMGHDRSLYQLVCPAIKVETTALFSVSYPNRCFNNFNRLFGSATSTT
jgi:hypothetical protein